MLYMVVVVIKVMHKPLKILTNAYELIDNLQEDDLVIITADHGNDPIAEEQIILENIFQCLCLALK